MGNKKKKSFPKVEKKGAQSVSDHLSKKQRQQQRQQRQQQWNKKQVAQC